MHVKKLKDRKAEWVLSRYQWERGEHKERVKEGKYGECILYSCTKLNNRIIKPVVIVLRKWGRGIRKNNGGVNLTIIYSKHICKCVIFLSCTIIICK
jgi:hypothetical protein